MPPTLMKAGFMKGTEEVPIDAIMRIVFEMQKTTEKVMILKSSTGSGKSTVLPATLARNLPRKIISAQPRVLNCKQIPDQIMEHNNFTLGKDIGYHTGDYQKIPKSGIIFVTNGILANYLLNSTDDEICKEYSVILIDEAHEMDTFGINIHFFLRNFIERNRKNPECPIIIITSATFDYAHFAAYYESNIILKVKGFTFPIQDRFLTYTSTNYFEDTVKIIEEINSQPIPEKLRFAEDAVESEDLDPTLGDDIIVFFSGKSEMDEVDKMIKIRKIPITVVHLNSKITAAEDQEYRNLNRPAFVFGTLRKVILSTNVGETGITYSYVKHCIDTGFFKPKVYIPDNSCFSFDKQPVSIFSAKQRKGRVGRIAPGNFYGVYTEEVFLSMRSKLLNTIYYEDITLTVLYLLSSLSTLFSRSEKRGANKDGKGEKRGAKELYIKPKPINIFDMKLIYKPSPASVWNSIEKLYILGFINAELEATFLGLKALQIPRLSAEQIKILLSGYVHNAPIPDLIIVVLALDEEAREKKKVKSLFARESLCDFIPLVEDFYNSALSSELQQKMYLLRDTMMEALAKIGLNPFANCERGYPHHGDDYYSIIKQCLYEGLRLNLCTLQEGSFYKTPRGLRLFKRTCGNYFVYSNIVYTTNYMKNGDAVKKPKILGKSILDGFINIAEDFL